MVRFRVRITALIAAALLLVVALGAEAVRLEVRKDEPGYNSDSWLSINIYSDSNRTTNVAGSTYCYLALGNFFYYPVDKVNTYRLNIPRTGKVDGGRYGEDFSIRFELIIENICRVRGYSIWEIPSELEDGFAIDIPATAKANRLPDGFLIVQNRWDKPVIVRLKILVENPEDGSRAIAEEVLSSMYPPPPEKMGKKFTNQKEWSSWFNRYLKERSATLTYSECRRQIAWRLDTNDDGKVGLNDFPSIAAAPALKLRFKPATLGSLRSK